MCERRNMLGVSGVCVRGVAHAKSEWCVRGVTC